MRSYRTRVGHESNMTGVFINRAHSDTETYPEGEWHVNTRAMLLPAKIGMFLPNVTKVTLY